ncbi:MAG: tetratricopeptide repeat protein [Proteobacteria bacterium]|nr:tetratricopeptide repeat protein [Pseudomonadota bacterium]
MLPLLLALTASAATGWNPTDAKAIAHFNDGLTLLQQAAPEKAEKSFRKAKKAEASGMVEHMLATALLRQNRSDEAIAMYSGLAESFADEPEVWAGYSESLFVGEEFDAALEAAERGVTLAPDNYNAQQGALSADLRLGNYEDARKRLTAYEKVGEQGYPGCLWVTLALELEDESLAQQKFADCEAHAEPGYVEGIRMSLAANGWDWSQASNSARAVGADRFADLTRVMDLVEQGRTDEGLAAANASIEAHGMSPGLQMIRGILLIDSGDSEAGLKDLEAVFGSEDWVDAERGGTLTGVLTAKSKRAWDINVTTAVVYAAAIYEEQGRADEADALIERTSERVGSQAPLQIARAELDLRRGKAAAWDHVVAALPEITSPSNSASHIGNLLFEFGGAPEAVVAWAETTADSGVVKNAMSGAANRKEYAPCLRMVQARAERFGHAEPKVGHICAVGAEDAEAATVYLKLAVQADQASPPTVQNHLAWLINAGDKDGASAVLDTAGHVLDEGLRNDMHARLLLGNGDPDALLTAANQPGVSPGARYNAGIELYNAQRYDEAQPLIEGACPELTGNAQAHCKQALDAVRKAPRP